jgi:hypothetical protein
MCGNELSEVKPELRLKILRETVPRCIGATRVASQVSILHTTFLFFRLAERLLATLYLEKWQLEARKAIASEGAIAL